MSKQYETPYEKLKGSLKKKAGRTPLSAEEKARRKELQKQQTRIRQEARRRAYLVLQHKYAEEFEQIFKEEFINLCGTNKSTK